MHRFELFERFDNFVWDFCFIFLVLVGALNEHRYSAELSSQYLFKDLCYTGYVNKK